MRLALGLLAILALGSCFSKPTARCAFLCGTGSVCPEGYECGGDGRCHLVLDSGDLAQCDDELDQPDARPVDASIDVISPTADAMPDADESQDAL